MRSLYRLLSVLRRLGSSASISTAGSLTATALLMGLAWPAYEWSQESNAAAEAAVDEAIYMLSLPPLRPLAVRGESEAGRLASLNLVFQSRGGAGVWLNDTRIEFASPDERATLAHGLAPIPLRDEDGSLTAPMANDGDLFEVRLALDALHNDVGPRAAFALWVWSGDGKPLHLEVETPANLPRHADLEWFEAA